MTYVRFPRCARENNANEDLRDALSGVVVDLMFGWLFDISWPMILYYVRFTNV
jgi:hypothetical protein